MYIPQPYWLPFSLDGALSYHPSNRILSMRNGGSRMMQSKRASILSWHTDVKGKSCAFSPSKKHTIMIRVVFLWMRKNPPWPSYKYLNRSKWGMLSLKRWKFKVDCYVMWHGKLREEMGHKIYSSYGLMSCNTMSWQELYFAS